MCNREECKEFKKWLIYGAIINYANLNSILSVHRCYQHVKGNLKVLRYVFVTHCALIIVYPDKYQPFVLLRIEDEVAQNS